VSSTRGGVLFEQAEREAEMRGVAVDLVRTNVRARDVVLQARHGVLAPFVVVDLGRAAQRGLE
jgi:hypothetical protein